MEKIKLLICFLKRPLPEYFAVISLSIELFEWNLSKAAGINERVTEETTNQNVSNATPLPFRELLLPVELDALKTLFYTLGKSEIDPVNLEQSILKFFGKIERAKLKHYKDTWFLETK